MPTRSESAAGSSTRVCRKAAAFLAGLDDDWRRRIEAVGPCRHEAKPAREPHEALVRAIGCRGLKRLPKTPSASEMRAPGLAWQPCRTIAAWYRWRVSTDA